jgi:hypothetical protein
MQGVNDESSSVRDFLVLPPPALIEQWRKSTKMEKNRNFEKSASGFSKNRV